MGTLLLMRVNPMFASRLKVGVAVQFMFARPVRRICTLFGNVPVSFSALKDVKYPMGSDRTGAVGRVFGVFDEASGLTLRGSFILNPEGRLMSSEIAFYNAGRNVDELLRKFKANIYLAKNPKEGCPSKWKDEGDKTLKPSAAMVGKVFEALQ